MYGREREAEYSFAGCAFVSARVFMEHANSSSSIFPCTMRAAHARAHGAHVCEREKGASAIVWLVI